MAKKKKTKEDYPSVKYRIITGCGTSVCEASELQEKLRRKIDFSNSDKYDNKRYAPQYVVRITEEYIDIDTILNS